MSKWVWLSAAMTALSATSVVGQDTRLQERLDHSTATRVQHLVDSARGIGLPTEPLVLKALEGQSKGAGSARIIAAVGELLNALGLARQHLGPASASDELVAGALWIRAGGGAEDLATFRALAPGRPLAVPLAISTELVSRGYSPRGAVESASTLLSAKISDSEFLALRDRVDRAVQRGSRFDNAVQTEVTRIREAKRGRS